MPESTWIVIRWLWIFHPSVWLGWAVAHLIGWCIDVIDNQDDRHWLTRDKANLAWYGGWIALAEARLDELIAMKAMKRLRRGWAGKRPLRHIPAPGVRTLAEAEDRLTRLIHRYHDAERLIARRARLLKGLFAEHEHRLEVIHHPVESTTISQIRSSTTIFPFDPDGDDDDFLFIGAASDPAHPRPARARPFPPQSSPPQPAAPTARTRAHARCKYFYHLRRLRS